MEEDFKKITDIRVKKTNSTEEAQFFSLLLSQYKTNAITITLYADTDSTVYWQGEGPYTQDITIPDLTMESIGVIGISDLVTDLTEIEMAREAALSFEQVKITESGEAKLRVTASNFKPTQDIHCSFLFIE